eukprot:TRINITY_DN23858_c0_g1_i1.p1 TRINITY_DN23858_c0_g1~~TRINITY_DN23858_c0_g1_i1.p1  ORF type:complete len:272 (+),score=48.25 TRINITY_DN23858_c0_g1_i1:92-907(+)
MRDPRSGVDIINLNIMLHNAQHFWHMAPPGICVFDVTTALAAQVGLDALSSIDLLCGSECLDVATQLVDLVGAPIAAVVRGRHFIDSVIESACVCPTVTHDRFAIYTRMLKDIQVHSRQLRAQRAHEPTDDFTTLLLCKLQAEFEACWTRGAQSAALDLDTHRSKQRLARLCFLIGNLYHHKVFHKTMVVASILQKLLSSPYGALPDAHQIDCACALLWLTGKRMQEAQSGRAALQQIVSKLDALASHRVFGMYMYAAETRAQVFDLLRLF